MFPRIEDVDPDGFVEIVKGINEEGYTYQDFTEITDQEMEAAYATAFGLVDQGQFVEAEKLFIMLCRLDHYSGRYWLGLGVCRQQLKKHEEAVKALSMAGILDLENPIPALRAAESHLALGNLNEAESGIAAALHWAGAKAEHEAVRSRAAALGEALQRRRKGAN